MSLPLVNPALADTWDQSTAPGCGGVVIYGGRGSSKTKDAACRAIWLMDMVAQNGGYLRFLCTRRFQNKVKESVYRELCWAISHLGMTAHFEVLATSIRHRRHPDAEFVFLGIERNSEDIKGLADVDIVWLEEAQNITEDQWNIIEPTLRKKGCQAWVIFNPKYVVDFAWKRFVLNPPRGWVVRRINYEENPFLEADYLQKIEDKREEDQAAYEHIYGGVPLGDSELSIFKRRWLDACVDAHTVLKLDLTGRNIVGFDPADDGEDKSATADKIDGVFVDAEDWSSGKDELVQNAKKVWAKAKRLNATVSYDTIGVGAFVGGYIDEQNEAAGAKVEHFAFHAGGAVMDGDKPSDPTNSNSPLNKDEYLNLKAQAWANTARHAMLTFNAVTRGQSIKPEDVLSFSSAMGKEKLDALFTELCVPWWVESEGKKRVVPKVKLKKDLGVKSHNLADAVIAADNVNMAALPKGWILTRGDSW